ncbi:MAG TPA: LmeA family phospholipid-binding protein [Chthonomonadales bacterium]|nr:LmeA family phospholipid-binding protein [Chthonomonadales bacterium]
MRNSTRLIPLVAAVVCLTGCGRAINRTAERRVRDALPNLIGDARDYRVHISNSAIRTIEGRLSDVSIDGDDVQLRNGLLLDNLHLDLRGVNVDTVRRRVRDVRSATFSATIGQAALEEFLAGESPQNETISDARVALGPGNRVTLAAKHSVLGIGVPFSVSGPLRLAGPQKVELDASRMSVVGIPIGGIALRFLKSRFNSALDLSALPFPLQLTGIQVSQRSLKATGSADVTAILQRSQQQHK